MTSPLEGITVALGLVYVVLAVRRSRWCWVYGGASSAGLAWLSVRSALPLQALLQAFYVAMAVYGFWRWSADSDAGGHVKVGWWPWRWHLAAWIAVAMLTVVASQGLVRYTQAAQPMLDAACTAGSLLATWLAARARIENWLYWIVVDAALGVLYAGQGLALVALLYFTYLVIAAIGFASWLRRFREAEGA
ncbi:MAG TPA: nicotinamide riboside transporter PnuC [Steroidobacteraceae bacterium]|nr:nicotinamide riboside transporter PnuC [Steroidobacteraceae bacterium]HQX46654.1 nicotinamide riboside transporter PnuC [Steroidobacteraceae bacterium]HQX77951.1 nicotinamide riboside transporter PnuC [Steroidobacteraceae bacterium]HQZ79627.1 nicotinamide riboside transporter PnuC [Steroidobacteraceae bacterium]